MTLLITCLTPEYLVQVSDRRLTRLDGTLYDDESNKAVFYLPGMVFAYTGLAEVNGVRTDEWLTSILKPGLDLARLTDSIAQEATRKFSVVRSPYRHLAIVGAFWARTGERQNQAGFCVISNFYGVRPGDGRFGPLPTASREFRVFTSLKPRERPFAVFGAGQSLTKHQINQLNRFGERYVRNTSGNPQSFGANGLCRYVSHFVRKVADTNTVVGKSLMQAILPNPRIPEVAAQAATFAYLPADSNSLTTYAPNLVNSSMSLMGVTFKRFASDDEFREHLRSITVPRHKKV